MLIACLLLLNVYWLLLFFKILHTGVTKGNWKDYQNPVEDTIKNKMQRKPMQKLATQ
jgi:hypothetical protein